MLLAYMATYGDVFMDAVLDKARDWMHTHGMSAGDIVVHGEEEEYDGNDDNGDINPQPLKKQQDERQGAVLDDDDNDDENGSDASALNISEQRGRKKSAASTMKAGGRQEDAHTGAGRQRPPDGDASHVSHHRRALTSSSDIESGGSGDYGISMQYLLCMMGGPKDDEPAVQRRKTNN